MAQELKTSDRRQFGRRTTLWHAWIKIAGRDREPCIVRNFSVAGALLEFPGAVPAINRFRLAIDIFRFEAECFVRHRSVGGLGVNFDELTQPDALSSCTPQELMTLLRRGRHLQG